MKANFTVLNTPSFRTHNCILVDNCHLNNAVYNTPVELKHINHLKDEESIGVWKIKKLKQS